LDLPLKVIHPDYLFRQSTFTLIKYVNVLFYLLVCISSTVARHDLTNDLMVAGVLDKLKKIGCLGNLVATVELAEARHVLLNELKQYFGASSLLVPDEDIVCLLCDHYQK